MLRLSLLKPDLSCPLLFYRIRCSPKATPTRSMQRQSNIVVYLQRSCYVQLHSLQVTIDQAIARFSL
jgi:hypothetical protein